MKRLNASSGNPTLGLTRYSEKGLKVIEVKRGPIAPLSGLIREWPRKGRCEERTLLLIFCQVVVLMLPHRSWFAGLFFPPLLKCEAGAGGGVGRGTSGGSDSFTGVSGAALRY